MSSSG